MIKQPTMECPTCKEIEFEHTGTSYEGERRTLEYTCMDCNAVYYYDEKADRDAKRVADLLDLDLQIFLVEVTAMADLSIYEQSLISSAFYRGARCAIHNYTHKKSGD